jgi:hypothetical protein
MENPKFIARYTKKNVVNKNRKLIDRFTEKKIKNRKKF